MRIRRIFRPDLPEQASKLLPGERAGASRLQSRRQLQRADRDAAQRLHVPAHSRNHALDLMVLTLREGKYHQVKRMLEARGAPVTALKRLSMGPLALDEALEPGQWRALSLEEKTALLALK